MQWRKEKQIDGEVIYHKDKAEIKKKYNHLQRSWITYFRYTDTDV